MRLRAAKVLQVIVRHFMRVGAQRRQLHPRLPGYERELVHFDGIEKILAALPAGKEVVDRSEQRIAAELPGVAPAFEAESFGKVEAVLAGLPWKNTGSPFA